MINFIVDFLFYFIIGIVVNSLILNYYQRKQIREEEIEEIITDNTVRFEKIINEGKTIWMVYAFKDDMFLAQGNSEEEATENLKKRFPDRDFWILEN